MTTVTCRTCRGEGSRDEISGRVTSATVSPPWVSRRCPDCGGEGEGELELYRLDDGAWEVTGPGIYGHGLTAPEAMDDAGLDAGTYVGGDGR